ncbi:MAG: hypothetical protein IJH59_08775, partial [Firmicutes bacterium]|nr:hypothetical protein [Bacillota bacterium]
KLSIKDLHEFMKNLKLTKQQQEISELIVKEINSRLDARSGTRHIILRQRRKTSSCRRHDIIASVASKYHWLCGNTQLERSRSDADIPKQKDIQNPVGGAGAGRTDEAPGKDIRRQTAGRDGSPAPAVAGRNNGKLSHHPAHAKRRHAAGTHRPVPPPSGAHGAD